MKQLDLKAFRIANKIPQSELASFLSVSPSFLSQVETGKRDLPESQLSKIMLNNRGWDAESFVSEVIESKLNKMAAEESRDIRLLPLLPFTAIAGALCEGNTTIDTYPTTEAVSFADFSKADADCVIRVDGDSMYPKYNSGDILAIRVLHSPSFFQWGKVYVLDTTQGCVIKKLFPDPNDENMIICHSENCENYPDYKIPKDEVLGIAIVVGHAGVE